MENRPFENLRSLVKEQERDKAQGKHGRHLSKTKPAVRPRNPIPPFELTPNLPVSLRATELIEAVKENQVIIVCGETGSGKTTQLPKICLKAGRGQRGLIGHTQPRRLAASSVAKRIAEEMKTPLGDVVGFKVRFTDTIKEGASVKLMTDGILLAETQHDPLLLRYDTIIIDEAHERSINIDFLLGYLKRLLPRRKDLKVIVTSATIDAERFSKHFTIEGKAAPIFTISGRNYPVEIRYRPIEVGKEDDDKTLFDALADAVEELEMEGRGDILCFLPGEREIREAGDVIRLRHKPGTIDIVPLFARLSAADQERVFKPGALRRVVLATNVAETSITVPGIRYVVDTGLARVKRYSYRNKVEQLLIEPVSRASSAQRAGRCGRLGPGICIRLFDELDWDRRAEYTDPEILRSNLAGVILKMKALKLGEVREFPFVEAPQPKAIGDGYTILGELHAMDKEGNLTAIGRDLARLPIDPRYSRILFEAHRQNALKEALVVVAGMAVQDPRERPLEAQEKADAAHKEFQDNRSDFLGYLKLWDWFNNANAAKESNRLFAAEMKRRFLSPRRMREWRDVYAQLLELTKELDWTLNGKEATYEELHTALLTGLLGNLGMRQLDADYKAPPFLGARGIHFWVWPGSALAKKAGAWVVAGELVETSRLFARNVADIEPAWAERVAKHLIKKSWAEPHWEKTRGEVVALEKGTLYGLPIYQNRRVSFTSHDPVLAREVFIRSALVEGEFNTKAEFFKHNERLIREVLEIEHKTRRPDVLVDDETLFAFYDEKIPKDIADSRSFDVWREKVEKTDPKILFLTKEDLMRRDAQGVTIDMYPKTLTMAGVAMALNYHFDPESPRDGITLSVPLYALNQIDPVRCEWLVPGMLKEKVQSLLKSLPQRFRRHLVPLKDYAEGFFARTDGVQVDNLSLIEALIKDIEEQLDLRVEKSDFKVEFLAPHLLMNFKVIDDNCRQLEMGRNLAQLRSALGQEAKETFRTIAEADQAVAQELVEAITTWSFGTLPELMEIKKKGVTLIGHPALVDKGENCTLEVFDDPAEARVYHKKGLRRLFALQLKEQIRFLNKNLTSLDRLQMQMNVFSTLAPSFENMREELIDAAIDTVCLTDPWPVDAASFGARKDEAKGKLNLVGRELATLLEGIVIDLSQIARKLQTLKAFPDTVTDVENQLRMLFPKHFLVSVAGEHLRHYPRYVKGIANRLDKVKTAPERDTQHRAEVEKFLTLYLREVKTRKGVIDENLERFRWLIEELRISLFAQELRTPIPVSVKRLTKVWESLKRF